jgi:hypothetical protein
MLTSFDLAQHCLLRVYEWFDFTGLWLVPDRLRGPTPVLAYISK